MRLFLVPESTNSFSCRAANKGFKYASSQNYVSASGCFNSDIQGSIEILHKDVMKLSTPPLREALAKAVPSHRDDQSKGPLGREEKGSQWSLESLTY